MPAKAHNAARRPDHESHRARRIRQHRRRAKHEQHRKRYERPTTRDGIDRPRRASCSDEGE